jgi:hypothetical protein
MEVVDVDDVFVLQTRETLRFALESRDDVFLCRGARFQRLDRDRTDEGILHGAINDRHSAAGDLFNDAAIANALEHRFREVTGTWRQDRRCEFH